MKIAILTQPLHNNYGGLLQAFALQHYLRSLNHDAMTIDFRWKAPTLASYAHDVISNILQKYILRRSINRILPLSNKQRLIISQHSNRFISEHIRITQQIHTLSEFSYIKRYQFDAYIVGSDQVWRPAYSPGMPAFFLSFLNPDDKAKRIAYAASFGVEHCNEYSAEQLTEYANLLQRFDAIGVREDSAVALCQQYFGTDAKRVIDPTLLLDTEIYCNLVKEDNCPPSDGNLMVHILDKSLEKQSIVQKISCERKLKPYTVIPDKNGVYPPVTQWLRGFMDAEYVVTDSFHGVIFSIIFNKPFIAVGNHNRGLARFTSILKMFHLEQRLISCQKDLRAEIINQPIDFSLVNKIKATEQAFSESFLKQALRANR